MAKVIGWLLLWLLSAPLTALLYFFIVANVGGQKYFPSPGDFPPLWQKPRTVLGTGLSLGVNVASAWQLGGPYALLAYALLALVPLWGLVTTWQFRSPITLTYRGSGKAPGGEPFWNEAVERAIADTERDIAKIEENLAASVFAPGEETWLREELCQKRRALRSLRDHRT